jgi:choline-glycine betaine transporter
MLFILLMGPTAFIIDSYIHSFGLYLDNFIPMATFRADKPWLAGGLCSFGVGF